MLIKTKCFGEIDLAEERIITFQDGLMGFEEFEKYTLLYNNEDGQKSNILWLQSIEEPLLAIPVANPFCILDEYDPLLEDEQLDQLGELSEENIMVLITLVVPSDITKMTANLKAPLVINADTRKGVQIIVENQDYPIRFNAYESIKQMKEQKGE